MLLLPPTIVHATFISGRDISTCGDMIENSGGRYDDGVFDSGMALMATVYSRAEGMLKVSSSK